MKRLLIIVIASLCLFGATAADAKTQIFGMNVTPDLIGSPLLPGQMLLMEKSGVQSVRINFSWEDEEPSPGVFTWATPDQIVTAAARAHLSLLPILEFTPPWASSAPDPQHDWVEVYAPKDPNTFALYMTALIGRYGPRGSFWKENPSLPRIPIRTWQIWNEPASVNYDWLSVPWYKTYPPLLKAGYIAAHKADPGVKIVAGSLVALACCTPSSDARLLYKHGWKPYFDVLAENVFVLFHRRPVVPSTIAWVETTYIKRVRDIMNRHGDARKPIWIDELTWPATRSYHTQPGNRSCHPGFDVTTAQQKQLLTAFYTDIATKHPDGIQRAYWFDWTSPYQGGDPVNCSFYYAGMTRWALSWSRPPIPMPILRTYSKVAHKYANR